MTQITWSSFDRFDPIIDRLMPMQGEGDTKASQMVTAINKLIYKWFNDGDVFDNTYALEGWWNDLSSYANWLSTNIEGAEDILSAIRVCMNDTDYENLLYELASTFLTEDMVAKYDVPKVGTIYDCNGPYKYEEADEEEEEDEDWFF